jgi:hypothetical protein
MTRSPEIFSPSIYSRTRAATKRSQRQAWRVQNAAFLLGIRPELPDVNDQDLEVLNRMRVVERCYDGMADSQAIKAQPCQELEKGD